MQILVGVWSIRPFGPLSKLIWQFFAGKCYLHRQNLGIVHYIDLLKACIPTLRPVWLVIRRKLFGSQPSDQPEQATRTRPPRRVQAPTWATRILKSNADDNEDTQPFSTVSSHVEEGSHRDSAFDQPRTEETVTIPLATLKRPHINDEGAMRV